MINVANSNSVPLVNAIIRGLKKRKEETGAKVAFVHTSGMLVFMEGNEGKKAGSDAKLWDVSIIHALDEENDGYASFLLSYRMETKSP